MSKKVNDLAGFVFFPVRYNFIYYIIVFVFTKLW
jgi:hypothetical protein